MAKSAEDVIEDAEFLDGNGVGAEDAARRLGFPNPLAMEKWLERKSRYDLWLRFKSRMPEGWHERIKRERGLASVEQTVDPIAHLIEQGRKSSKARIRNKAERIDALVGELREAVRVDDASERIKEKARQDVAKLERQLAEAKARLRGDAVAPDGPTAAEVRAWAAENGVTCPDRGRIPADVREAFDAAREDAA